MLKKSKKDDKSIHVRKKKMYVLFYFLCCICTHDTVRVRYVTE